MDQCDQFGSIGCANIFNFFFLIMQSILISSDTEIIILDKTLREKMRIMFYLALQEK